MWQQHQDVNLPTAVQWFLTSISCIHLLSDNYWVWSELCHGCLLETVSLKADQTLAAEKSYFSFFFFQISPFAPHPSVDKGRRKWQRINRDGSGVFVAHLLCSSVWNASIAQTLFSCFLTRMKHQGILDLPGGCWSCLSSPLASSCSLSSWVFLPFPAHRSCFQAFSVSFLSVGLRNICPF